MKQAIKTVISLFLTFALLLSCAPFSFAEDAPANTDAAVEDAAPVEAIEKSSANTDAPVETFTESPQKTTEPIATGEDPQAAAEPITISDVSAAEDSAAIDGGRSMSAPTAKPQNFSAAVLRLPARRDEGIPPYAAPPRQPAPRLQRRSKNMLCTA